MPPSRLGRRLLVRLSYLRDDESAEVAAPAETAVGEPAPSAESSQPITGLPTTGPVAADPWPRRPHLPIAETFGRSRERWAKLMEVPAVPARLVPATHLWWRTRVVAGLIGVVWLGLVGRLVQLQWVDRTQFAEAAVRQSEFLETIPPRAGDILDRYGRVLATSQKTPSLYAIPSRVENVAAFAEPLATALGLDRTELTQRLESQRGKHFLWIKRRLDDDEAERVRQAKLPAKTWGFRDEYRRLYPQGAIAAQLLGQRNIDGVGQGGLEESLEKTLAGQAGRRRSIRDARGRVVDVLDEASEPPVDGKDVVTTIDSFLQLATERELDKLLAEWKPQSCCAIVLAPATGEILAMASRPTFDPNAPQEAAADAWKNRCLSDIYEPGSTFKPFVVARAVDRGLARPDEMFDCEHGQYRMGRRVLHDHHGYGLLSLTDILVKSSNIGMAKVGERLQNEGLYDACIAFGFGRKTGIELPGELTGVLRPLAKWNSYSTGSIPMGHEIAATPLQMITAHGAIANGGTLIQPTILRDNARAESLLKQSVIRPETATWLVEGAMREVVVRGTGKKAALPDYDVFGKTGTAQTLDENGGYRHSSYISSFLCGGPVKSPQALVLVVVDQASVGGEAFGGKVAAPTAAAILQQTLRHLRVPPDHEPVEKPAPKKRGR